MKEPSPPMPYAPYFAGHTEANWTEGRLRCAWHGLACCGQVRPDDTFMSGFEVSGEMALAQLLAWARGTEQP